MVFVDGRFIVEEITGDDDPRHSRQANGSETVRRVVTSCKHAKTLDGDTDLRPI